MVEAGVISPLTRQWRWSRLHLVTVVGFSASVSCDIEIWQYFLLITLTSYLRLLQHDRRQDDASPTFQKLKHKGLKGSQASISVKDFLAMFYKRWRGKLDVSATRLPLRPLSLSKSRTDASLLRKSLWRCKLCWAVTLIKCLSSSGRRSSLAFASTLTRRFWA